MGNLEALVAHADAVKKLAVSDPEQLSLIKFRDVVELADAVIELVSEVDDLRVKLDTAETASDMHHALWQSAESDLKKFRAALAETCEYIGWEQTTIELKHGIES